MIEELRIRGLGVIDEAVVPLAPGLTVLTGETGAGKTMILSGLALIMGGRAESGVVRNGAERADVDAVWVLPRDSAEVALIGELGGDVDEWNDEEVQASLGRSVNASGRSRAFAGGRPVPASTLATLTAGLITVHGQSEQLRLRERTSQRDVLDRFGGSRLMGLRERFAGNLEALRRAQHERDRLQAERQEREREATLLRHGIAEIDEVQPQPGEDIALKQQATALAHVTDLLKAAGAVHTALAGGSSDAPGVADLLATSVRELDRAVQLDPELSVIGDAVRDLHGTVAVLAEQVAGYAASLDADPVRQAQAEERRHRIGELKRRYGPELDDVLAWWASAKVAVDQVDGTQERLDELDGQITSLTEQVQVEAAQLTRLRRSTAKQLATRVTAELRELAMPDATLSIDIDTVETIPDMTPAGADTVTMLLTPHAGSDARPLGAGASGGELSRVMLAIEVVLADVDRTPTFVFDEVDAGIGGRVAVEVGRRLARLARSAQVVVVTHLPQVAAFADSHVVVAKDSSGHVTTSSVSTVDGEDRVRELVRMLSGLEGSASGAEHAAELLQLADGERAATVGPAAR